MFYDYFGFANAEGSGGMVREGLGMMKDTGSLMHGLLELVSLVEMILKEQKIFGVIDS